MVAQSGNKPGREHLPPKRHSAAEIHNASCCSLTTSMRTAPTPAPMASSSLMNPRHDYGADYWVGRSYAAVDMEGHLWWFTQRIRDEPEK